MKRNGMFIIIVSLFLISFNGEPLFAYGGPGAGFAFLASFLMLFISFLVAFLSLLSWPFRVTIRFFKRRKALQNAKTDRFVVLGLDGLEPTITEKLLAEGKLPNLKKLKEQGAYSKIQTTFPALSPVAWSTFATGVNPGRHDIFDFLQRDLRLYLPRLSSSEVRGAKRTLKIGKYHIPLGKPTVRFLRRSQSFWKILGKNGIYSHVLRVPITFPPEKFNGAMLSAMCTPDLWGTQGMYSYFTTDAAEKGKFSEGETIILKKDGEIIRGEILGPENTLEQTKEPILLPFQVKVLGDQEAELILDGKKYPLLMNRYSPWIELRFRAGMGIKVHGIARFYLLETRPHFKLYMTPINIDPEKPALPVAYPYLYSIYLSKLHGKFATLGLAEDTWSLNEGVMDEKAFLEQAYLIHEEREKQFFDALDKTKKGFCAVVIDGTDRIQHMFFRTLEEDHPANRERETEAYKNVIEDLYIRMDGLVGRTMEKIKKDDVFVVMSDHGFKSFKRGINLNSWLMANGYLYLKAGLTESGPYCQGVDWSRTRAYCFGLAGMFINLKGREKNGIVEPGEEFRALKAEISEKLSGIRDPENGEIAIIEMVDSHSIYNGPYVDNAPDLISGYNVGYRISWNGARGIANDSIFEDNDRPWSGDHCIHPHLVPGVIFCNRPIYSQNPSLLDMAPSVLDQFGIQKPKYMEGKSIFTPNGDGSHPAYSPQVNQEIKEKMEQST